MAAANFPTSAQHSIHSSLLPATCQADMALATPSHQRPHIRPPLLTSIAGAGSRMPGLLLLLVAQLLDCAHRAEHYLGRQLRVMRGAGFAAGICVGVPIQARVCIGVGIRIGHVIVV